KLVTGVQTCALPISGEYFGDEVVHVVFGCGGLFSRVEVFASGLFLRCKPRAFGNRSRLLTDGLNSGRGQGRYLDRLLSRLADRTGGLFRSVARSRRSSHWNRSIPRRSKAVRLFHLGAPGV